LSRRETVGSNDGLGVLVDEHGELSMPGKWTEVLPLFVVRWLALRYCERVPFEREGNARVAAIAKPDVLVRVLPKLRDMNKDDFNAAHGG
jgi:hypothetical protein